MLKRPRAASPPPTLPTLPFIPNSSAPDCVISRTMKRRRVLPLTIQESYIQPVRPHREYDQNQSISSKAERREKQELLSPTKNLDILTDDYKSTNSLLHELHVLQRHRLIFSSPASQEYPSKVHRAMRLLDRTHGAPESWIDQVPSDVRTRPLKAEVLHVTEQYENTNRLLGQLFLTRKRELGQPVGENIGDS